MLAPPASIRALTFRRRLPFPRLHPLALLPRSPPPPPRPSSTPARSFMVSPAETASEEEEALPAGAGAGAGDGGEVSTVEWPRWGTSAPLPAEVADVVRQMLEMEFVAGKKMRFGGPGSKIKGDFKDVEDRKHRAVYETLADSDQKLQYHPARRIGCRLRGSRGDLYMWDYYMCNKCWLMMDDCMCS